MPLAVVQPRLVEAALSRVTGAAFEQFTQEFLSALLGRDFVPLGGVKDGGADGWVGDRVYEDQGNGGTFMQASTEEGPEGKIERTVRRLREFGRTPKTLLYVTSRAVKHVDRLEDRLTTELDVVVRIREASYLANQVNNSAQTIAAFDHHLRSFTDWLRFPGASPVITESKHVKSPAVYVFLRQELERTSGDTKMVDSVTDALIMWALEDTDPEAGRLLTPAEILTKICATVPSAKALVTEALRDRLVFLTNKARENARIGWYKA